MHRPPPPGVSLRAALWAGDHSLIESVRRQVFIEEQGISAEEEWDAIDPLARHVLALAGKRDAVGTGRLEPTGKIGRVAVLVQHRGTGVGGAIVGYLVNQATELGFTKVYLHAQTAALAFYERLGFRAEGSVFDEVGIPHLRMTLGIEQSDEHEAGRHWHEEHPLDAR